jgi:hypothetical protein
VTRPQKVTAEFYLDSGPESPERSLAFLIQAIKAAPRNLRSECSAVVLIRDEDGKIIGMDVTGTVSGQLKLLLEEMVDDYAGTPP